MKTICKVNDYYLIPGSPAMLKQGVKGGRRPKNAVAGGNGSYIVKDKMQLVIAMDNGTGYTLRKDIAPVARGVCANLKNFKF